VRVSQVGMAGGPGNGYKLVNGNTIHGEQFFGPGEGEKPTTYYGPDSGVGLALLNHPLHASGLKVGALGLGVGTIAAYGQPGDLYRFYEINPIVIQLAEGQGGYFSYLEDTRAKVELVPGDARLSLENELTASQAQEYDVLVLDVFSNDSIPVHLLDKEAFALYLQFLAPGGILAAHITNGYLDLVPVVWELADHFNLERAVIEDPGDGKYTRASTWMLLSREPSVLAVPAIASRVKSMNGYTSTLRLWTDEYSNLFQILKH
jgi:SAM-dependent methyltransferase